MQTNQAQQWTLKSGAKKVSFSTIHILIKVLRANDLLCDLQMCEVLGIVEVDYFGLKYADRLAGCEAWVNTRLNLRRQLKRTNQPYRLAFRVKFFTDSILLQQPSTKLE